MIKTTLSIAALSLAVVACGPAKSEKETTEENIEEIIVTEEEWISLFDGNSLTGWTGFGKDQPGEAWEAADGVLYFNSGKKDEGASAGDLVTKETFGNFHLQIEWKISENGNSGIMFHVQDNGEYDRPYHTGPEYQVLDNDGHKDGQIITHRAGDLYDMIESSEEAAKPVGEWNKTEIIINDNTLQFFLNGVKTVETTLWDDQWKAMVAESKFSKWEGFAKYKEGKIVLQDHGDDVWFRNIKIKRL
ncbi:DUF1080 domain-containing protein [Cyclobacterium sp. 1_MG-2023]|uniref:3-keto-disaccharide hydrolase n=1 Tax=Cyclobacterium sp. 1_MG-2023 TaxID=3062681 RepID=UPI0026E240C6|nr:DUF1080 domain-containing protein [Cyclobacterium sp. 1_MG-2023]MDO6438161.1 DUF1080 domain-containing protein [Cyclobacterium sp. 1_MG-2023]